LATTSDFNTEKATLNLKGKAAPACYLGSHWFRTEENILSTIELSMLLTMYPVGKINFIFPFIFLTFGCSGLGCGKILSLMMLRKRSDSKD
jgi:hypothetical protein